MLGRLKDQFNMTLVQGQEEAKNRRRQLQGTHNQHSGSTEDFCGRNDSEDLAILQVELAELRETIERFQKALQEKTPLSSISDIDGFLEYLDNLEQRYEISIREVKRLSNELQEADALFKASKKEFEEKFKVLEEKFISELARLSGENQKKSGDKAISLSNIEEYVSVLPSTPATKAGVVSPETTTTSNKASSKKKKRKNKKNQVEKHVNENIEPTQENSNIFESVPTNASENSKENVHINKLSSFETYLQLSDISVLSAPLPTLTESEETFLHLSSVPIDETLQTTVESLRKELEAAEQKLKTESATFHDQNQNHKDKISRLISSVESLKKDVEESHQNLLWAETSCDSLREEKQGLLERLAVSENVKSRLIKSSSEVQKTLDSCQEKLAHTFKELEKANGKQKETERELETLQKVMEEKTNRISELNKKVVLVTEQSSEYSRQVYETKEAIQTRQEEFEEVYKLLIDQTRDCQKLRSLVEQLEIDRIDCQNTAEVRIHQLTEHYTTVLKERDSALLELEGRHQTVISELGHYKLKDAELTQQNQELSNGIQNIKIDRDDSNYNQRPEKEDALRALEAEKKSLATALDESTARYEHLQKSFKVMFGQHRRKQSQGSLSDRNSSASVLRTSVDQQNSNSMVDKEYTRNILFQFLEQRERRADIVNLLSILLELSTEQKEQLLSIKN
ncbi:Golgi GRIP domain protein Grp1 [Schizosaccharomyces osmophilus]|uniref:Golgi GRIP domain protein Grp1 n=1 Tax=Schizosaccharomyces osmophilus TaxID=2545709 RepID=A0AAF0AWP6_9SCHI|nr:Golgi GRIP domain protein Grp1 [Schizosaccharomyces osmophilus]WBW73937.1 Golgi GRIP domain protein Grp1 [Schizosaccharomyces osmophilus]